MDSYKWGIVSEKKRNGRGRETRFFNKENGGWQQNKKSDWVMQQISQ